MCDYGGRKLILVAVYASIVAYLRSLHYSKEISSPPYNYV